MGRLPGLGEPVDWPSPGRGLMRESEAWTVARALGGRFADAYRLAAYVAECELSDGRGGEPLHEAAEMLCTLLWERSLPAPWK